ncbi:MAG TPA: pilus assembly protein PilP [Polyangiaceae bacterium]|nr:pilus assembly protein PilP [Polyangiaceae bacterium]
MKRIALLSLALGLVACEEEAAPTFNTGAAATVDRRAAPVAETPATPPPPAMELQEAEFVENDRSRDPFRSFAKFFLNEARGEVRSQREVVLEQFAIDELKLVGIIGGINPERAMLVDPTGVGWVVQRGQYVGRSTVVQPTGGVGAAYEVNWRVDRIRDGDLVLVRDDPSNPEVPSATRVIQLRSDEVTTSADSVDEGAISDEIATMKQRLSQFESQESAKKKSETPGTPKSD